MNFIVQNNLFRKVNPCGFDMFRKLAIISKPFNINASFRIYVHFECCRNLTFVSIAMVRMKTNYSLKGIDGNVQIVLKL